MAVRVADGGVDALRAPAAAQPRGGLGAVDLGRRACRAHGAVAAAVASECETRDGVRLFTPSRNSTSVSLLRLLVPTRARAQDFIASVQCWPGLCACAYVGACSVLLLVCHCDHYLRIQAARETPEQAAHLNLTCVASFARLGAQTLYHRDRAGAQPTLGFLRMVPVLCDFGVAHDATAVTPLRLPATAAPPDEQGGGDHRRQAGTEATEEAAAAGPLERSTSIRADERPWDEARAEAGRLAAEFAKASAQFQPLFASVRAQMLSVGASCAGPSAMTRELSRLVSRLRAAEDAVDDLGRSGRQLDTALASFQHEHGAAVAAREELLMRAGRGFSLSCTTPSWVVGTLAGSGVQGLRDGHASKAQFHFPETIVCLLDGRLACLTHNNHIRLVEFPSGTRMLSVTTCQFDSASKGGAEYAEYRKRLSGMCLDGTQGLLVTDRANHCIYRLTLPNKVSVIANLHVIAGVPGKNGFRNGSASGALFNDPVAIAVRKNGMVIISDRANRCLRALKNDTVAVLCGKPGEAGYVDGNRKNSRLVGPKDLLGTALMYVVHL
jgi:hypothetical protein